MKVCFIDMMNEEEDFEDVVDFINDLNVVKRILTKCKSDIILIGRIGVSIEKIFFDIDPEDCYNYILYITIMDGSNTVCTLGRKNDYKLFDWSRTIEFADGGVIAECYGDENENDFLNNAKDIIKK